MLPQEERPPGDGARWGTLVHHWLATGDTGGSGTLERKLVWLDREVWWPTGRGEHETTFALRLDDRLVLQPPPGADRDEWKKQFPVREWVTGSIDWLWTTGALDDLKTGRFPPSPWGNRQLLTYALLPWSREGYPIDWESTVSITHWPKYPLHVLPARTTALITGLDLAEHLEDLRAAAANPYDLQPSVEGCRYCPSLPHCEAA